MSMENFYRLSLFVAFAIAIFSCKKENDEQTTTNSAPTNITISSDSVVEKYPAGTVVGQIIVSDPDNGSHTLTLIAGEGDNDNDKFSIDGNNLVTAQKFDYTVKKEYSVRINAFDGANNFSKAIPIHIKKYVAKIPTLTSNMFEYDYLMPVEVGKNFGNKSPQFNISNVPPSTVEMALTMRDMDDGDSWHWAVWNIPPTKTIIDKNEDWNGLGVTIGDNDFGSGYVGPFPPSEHRYKFTIYFLSEKINLKKEDFASLPNVIQGKIIDHAINVGRYK